MNEHALREVIECLGQLADAEFQERVWVRGEGPEVSSYVELVCQLFDDTGLGDLLDRGTAASVLGPEAAVELLRLRQLVDAVPADGGARSVVGSPVWKHVLRAASTARALLQGSTGGL